MEWCEGESHYVSNKEVREWKKLIYYLREQAKTTADAIAVQNIINLFILFVFLCLSLFLTVLLFRGSLSDASKNTTHTAICLTALGLGRLAAKSVIAERISFQVSQFYKHQKQIRSSC